MKHSATKEMGNGLSFRTDRAASSASPSPGFDSVTVFPFRPLPTPHLPRVIPTRTSPELTTFPQRSKPKLVDFLPGLPHFSWLRALRTILLACGAAAAEAATGDAGGGGLTGFPAAAGAAAPRSNQGLGSSNQSAGAAAAAAEDDAAAAAAEAAAAARGRGGKAAAVTGSRNRGAGAGAGAEDDDDASAAEAAAAARRRGGKAASAEDAAAPVSWSSSVVGSSMEESRASAGGKTSSVGT